MNSINDRPSWLPPLPPPHRGRALIAIGLLLVVATFIYIFVMSYVGGTHTLYTLLPLAIGLVCLIVGLTRRNEGR
ncbi:cysteine-rich outer membrane protein [uncultured Arthrobacter sp.]|uniref:cysteine-rich outer membrane protein n=1 Tax=uncultured Arthrobacter sp. TaxID=114050 RepID=UPI0026203572|nr:cysteine-rich outer membrane protein [uncultured Arthrobacter sp.]